MERLNKVHFRYCFRQTLNLTRVGLRSNMKTYTDAPDFRRGTVFEEELPNDFSIDIDFDHKLEKARYLVSLWSHSTMADGIIKPIEKKILIDLLDDLFDEGNLFNSYKDMREEISYSLLHFFYCPFPLEDIYSYINKNKYLANTFYEDACNIIVADVEVTDDEKKFLNQLSEKIKLYKVEKKIINEKYQIR